MTKLVAAIAFLFLVAGVIARKNRRIHPILMATGIAIDFGLVIFLQLRHDVVESAMTETYTLWQSGHIIASTLAVILYVAVVPLGVLLVLRRGGPLVRVWHIRIALTAFAFRAAGFLLMFTV